MVERVASVFRSHGSRNRRPGLSPVKHVLNLHRAGRSVRDQIAPLLPGPLAPEEALEVVRVAWSAARF
jgi:hypothetical protein